MSHFATLILNVIIIMFTNFIIPRHLNHYYFIIIVRL